MFLFRNISKVIYSDPEELELDVGLVDPQGHTITYDVTWQFSDKNVSEPVKEYGKGRISIAIPQGKFRKFSPLRLRETLE